MKENEADPRITLGLSADRPLHSDLAQRLIDSVVEAEVATIDSHYVLVCLGEPGLLSVEGPYQTAIDALIAAEEAQDSVEDTSMQYVVSPLIPAYRDFE